VLTAVVLQAQDQPTFRTGANYVRVDMYATVDGKSIEDLTAEDVEVLEDGAPQKVEAFEHVQVRQAGPQESRREPTTVEQSRQMAAEGRARVFVIFLDTYHTSIEGSANMRLPLIKFIDRLLGPDDMVALMTPEMGASEIALGRKTTVISNIMQAQWMWGRKGRLVDDDPKEQLYQECYGIGPMVNEMKARRREKLTLDALSDLMVHLAGVREERKALVVVSEGWQLFHSNPSLTAGDDASNRVRPEDVLKRSPRPSPSDNGTSTAPSSRAECEADRVALASLDHTQRLREITDEANRGNVTFYPVYARGLVAFDAPIGPDKPPSIRDDQANLRVKQDGLRFLADNTDGTSIINTNNVDGMLQRIRSRVARVVCEDADAAARVVEPGARVLPAGTRRAGEARRCGTRAVLVQRRQLPAPGTRERAGEEAQRLADQHRAGIRAESAISDVRADRTATVERNADKLAGAGCTAFTRRVALAEPRVSTRVSAV